MTKEPINTTWKDINKFIHEVKPTSYIANVVILLQLEDGTLKPFNAIILNKIDCGLELGVKVKYLQIACNN